MRAGRIQEGMRLPSLKTRLPLEFPSVRILISQTHIKPLVFRRPWYSQSAWIRCDTTIPFSDVVLVCHTLRRVRSLEILAIFCIAQRKDVSMLCSPHMTEFAQRVTGSL